jgi:hypothetical protein
MKISYENFKKQMTDIVNFQELSDSISDTMRVYNSKSKDNAEIWFPSLICNTVELLEMLTNDTKSQWISYYVFELDCGKDYKDGSITDKDGGIIKLQTIDDLWNLLKSEESYMIFEEIQQDLFTVPQGYYLAHCISGDYALGAGIAKKFDEIYNMRFKLHKNYAIPEGEKFANVGRALLVDNVFNLVTKQRCFHKPTYDTLYETLEDMKEQCIDFDITKIAMPYIGCGLDRLDWNKVKDVIEDVFEDTDIEILVCKL